jgi:cytochrome oxidase Cu insertion factor (SCO1/SenC/PrrC family)
MLRVLLLLLSLFVLAATAFGLRAWAADNSAPRYVLGGTDVFSRHNALHAPPFALLDQSGRMIRLSSLHGHVLAITFLDSTCTKECPVAGRDLASTQNDLGRHSTLTVIVISVAPQHDTPATVQRYVREVGLTGPWHWLFGTHKQLVPVWRSYGILVQPVQGDIQHTAAVYLVDQRGLVRVADGVPFLPGQLAGSVKALRMGV